jgi:hypothetical protein
MLFIIFIASMMHSVWPGLTWSPRRTNGGGCRWHDHLAALPNPKLEALGLEFEFAELVVAGEIQNLLEIVDVDHRCSTSSGRRPGPRSRGSTQT